jgi:hypothetical protein
MDGFTAPPRTTFVVHGEGEASAAFAARLGARAGWQAHCPQAGETAMLAPASAPPALK